MDKLLSLGIKWESIVLYLVNFGILFIVIAKYLVPKLVGFLDERTKIIKNSIEEANQLKSQFELKLKKIEEQQAESKVQQANELQQLKKELEAKRTELIEQMETERNEMLAKTEKEMVERKEALFQEAEKQMLQVIEKMVLYIVRNKLPQEVVNQSVQEAWKEYKK